MAKLKYYDNDNNNLKFDSKYLNGRKVIEQKRRNIQLSCWIINNNNIININTINNIK